ncbi:hypothetical protein PTTG_02195 [Puccinia triticina 1-1 BBBD Race 1]|uniref:Uncharacterized protein n=2 Tax=Puccinia triticina TaxID=208348 RepID=A0A0C4EN55_PUCT1|nr:hypothetical protein PTTG_02195 [Puccinia triticina 1-1 BBBD Race 1]
MHSVSFLSILLLSSAATAMPNGYSYTNHPSEASEYYSVIYGGTPYYGSGTFDNQPSTYDSYWDPTLASSYPHGRVVAASGGASKTDTAPVIGRDQVGDPDGRQSSAEIETSGSANLLN